MTREEFVDQFGQPASKMAAWGELAVPCDCGDEICHGWQYLSEFNAAAYAEMGHYSMDDLAEARQFRDAVLAAGVGSSEHAGKRSTPQHSTVGSHLMLQGPVDRTKVPMLRIEPPGNPEGWVNLWWDGRLEHGPGYQPNEAATIFWDHVKTLALVTRPEMPVFARPA